MSEVEVWDSLCAMVRGADMIIESARGDGMPTPTLVKSARWGLQLQVLDRAAVEAYANWRGWIVTSKPTANRCADVVQAKGTAYDVPVEVYAVEAVMCACGHSAESHHNGSGCSSGSPLPCSCSRGREAVIHGVHAARASVR